MKPHRKEVPLAYFFRSHDDAPTLDWRPPDTALGLYHLAGYAHRRGWNPGYDNKGKHLRRQPGYYRYRPFVKRWPRLRDWLQTRRAFVPPPTWPAPVASVMPPHVDPFAFQVGCLPTDPRTRDNGALYHFFKDHPRGFGALAAWSVGWPVLPRYYPAMAEAAEALQREVAFLLWAYPVNLETLPLQECEDDPWRPRGARAVLVQDPLAAGRRDVQLGLPAWAQDPEQLLRLPAQPFDPGRSSRTPLLAVANDQPTRQTRWWRLS